MKKVTVELDVDQWHIAAIVNTLDTTGKKDITEKDRELMYQLIRDIDEQARGQ